MKYSKFVFFILSTLWSGCGKEIHLNKFPKVPYHTIVAYKMDGQNGEVVENGKVSKKTIGKGEVLTNDEAKKLLGIFHNTSTYGDNSARCFEPHVGYVFYNEQDQIIAHATICLGCNWMKTEPDIGAFMFSKKGAKAFRQIEKTIFSE